MVRTLSYTGTNLKWDGCAIPNITANLHSSQATAKTHLHDGTIEQYPLGVHKIHQKFGLDQCTYFVIIRGKPKHIKIC